MAQPSQDDRLHYGPQPGRRVVSAGEQPQAGDLRWFRTPLADLNPSHLVYRSVLSAMGRSKRDEGAPVLTQHIDRRDARQVSPEGNIGADSDLT